MILMIIFKIKIIKILMIIKVFLLVLKIILVFILWKYLMKLPRPFKGLRSPPLEIAGKKK